MPFFLVPIVAGAAAYGAATQEHADEHQSQHGERTIDAYQIWQQITSGPGAGSIQDGHQSAETLKGRYETRMEKIRQLSKAMDAAWQGDAGSAVNSGAHPLKIWMEDSQTNLGSTSTALEGQNTAFTTVRSKVQEVPPKPPESGFLNTVTPWETDTDRAIKDYNTKAQVNVDAFNAYFTSSQENAKTMPTYKAVDGEFGDIEVDPDGGDKGRGDTRQPPGTGDRPGNGFPPGGTPPGGNQPGGVPPGGYQPGGVPPGGYQPGGTPPGGYQPGGTPPGGYQPGGVPPGSYRPGGDYPGWNDGTDAASYQPGKVPSVDIPSATGGFPPGGGGGTGGGTGSGGIGGAGGFVPGGAGGFGPGGGSGAAAPGASSGTGAPGSGAGALRGGAAAAGAIGGGRGAGMMGGMPMGGAGGRGKGSEDEEHQTKFLIEEDPNSLFGTDELTAPPVIGE
ncbi:PPE family protein [Amycolatopsis arida]|uniref:PPE family protein n=1 Tax=Amycolatopsis arida TaxID=587909 RepID=A0A1I5TNJ1_9PSEU|nr:PPE domain-containing protein [Amycolatopsis arida]TDX96031.1 PPE family protein [Amycolatopsis arida]SFP84610.1 PPE family protein [Amycolatopsis arida]